MASSMSPSPPKPPALTDLLMQTNTKVIVIAVARTLLTPRQIHTGQTAPSETEGTSGLGMIHVPRRR
eukprot:11981834-Alexandrium_andersonii.AAC.1